MCFEVTKLGFLHYSFYCCWWCLNLRNQFAVLACFLWTQSYSAYCCCLCFYADIFFFWSLLVLISTWTFSKFVLVCRFSLRILFTGLASVISGLGFIALTVVIAVFHADIFFLVVFQWHFVGVWSYALFSRAAEIIYGLRGTFHGRCGRWRTSLEADEVILKRISCLV